MERTLSLMTKIDISHRFVTARGVRHHVAEAGSGPGLVLLHGWPEFWATWEPMFERLSHRYRLIAPDFRGFGESENPHLAPTNTVNASTLADDIVALLDALAIDRCGFAGHDVGANVMQSIGVRYPARASGLLPRDVPGPFGHFLQHWSYQRSALRCPTLLRPTSIRGRAGRST
jgi:pimeloyl-ACP methyl ester carboxylesterase